MKRIFIDKDDTVAAVVEKIIESADTDITIVIPKNSALRASISNFRIIKRESEEAQKNLAIESVDNDILVLAEKAGIGAIHPLLQADARGRSFSDIVSQKRPGKEPPVFGPKQPARPAAAAPDEAEPEEDEQMVKVPVKVKKATKGGRPPKITDEQPIMTADDDEEASPPAGEGSIWQPKEAAPSVFRGSQVPSRDLGRPSGQPALVNPASLGAVRGEPEKPRRSLPLRAILLTLGLVVAFAGGAWLVNVFFGKANIEITFRKTPAQFSGPFIASKTVTAKSTGLPANRLPAEVLSQSKNLTQFFPASGRASVSQKATGRLTIYNAYSSQEQSLVATTRFVTPDGKIFRLDTATIVPGAAIKDGKIIPSSVITTVTADKAGVEYNIGPTDKLTIPGFKGTPKYDGFYGQLTEPTTGGFIGERATPTEEDIIAAKEKTADQLRVSLANNAVNNRPADLKIIDGTSETYLTRLVVNKNTDDKGNFSVLGEAVFRAVAFREGDLEKALVSYATKDRPGLVFKEKKITYKDAKADFDKGEVSFTAAVEGVLGPDFDPDNFKGQLLGLDAAAARKLLLGLPELVEAKISLNPVWLSSIPKQADRVTITLK